MKIFLARVSVVILGFIVGAAALSAMAA